MTTKDQRFKREKEGNYNPRRQRRFASVLHMDQTVQSAAGAAFVRARYVEISGRGGIRVFDSGLRGRRLDQGRLVDPRGLAGGFDSEHEADFDGVGTSKPPSP